MLLMFKTIMLALLITVSAWFFIQWLEKNDDFQIKNIVLTQALANQNEQELLMVSQQAINGNFFSLDIDALRLAIEKLAWIEKVSVRKVWSDSIHLNIVEKKPMARWINLSSTSSSTSSSSTSRYGQQQQFIENKLWDQKSLVSQQGVIFEPKLNRQQLKTLDRFPIFSGPRQLVTSIEKKCSLMKDLTQKVNLKMLYCLLDKRRSWSVGLTAGNKQREGEQVVFHLMLGNSKVNELEPVNIHHKVLNKIKLFIALYQDNLHHYAKNIDKVDMRYPNGFSVKWKS